MRARRPEPRNLEEPLSPVKPRQPGSAAKGRRRRRGAAGGLKVGRLGDRPDGGLLTPAGETCKVTNCDGFRLAFINIATNVLDIAGVTVGDIGPIENGGYLTTPHTTAIDHHWVGNVRTESGNFAEVGSFKFSEHHFARFGAGHLYDPTTNQALADETEMKWCTYTIETDPTVQGRFQGLRLFRITSVDHPDVACADPRYLVEIGSSGGWPTNLLTSRDHLDLGTIALMNAGTSRI